MAHSPLVRNLHLIFSFNANFCSLRVYPAEIFPLAVRARGNAFGVVGWSIGNGWLVSEFPLMNTMTYTDRTLKDSLVPRHVQRHWRKDIVRLRRQ